MIHIISRDLPKRRLHIRRGGSRFIYRYIQKRLVAPAVVRPRAFRALVLLLVALIMIFVSLMLVIGHYAAGAPVIGSILLIGLGASHWS